MNLRSLIRDRESRAFRHSALGWCVVAGTMCATSLVFLAGLLSPEGDFLRLEQLWCCAAAVCVPFTAAFATMRLFAGERRNGTLPSLLASPATEAELVSGKAASAFRLVLLSAACSVLPLFLLRGIAGGLPPPDSAALAGSAVFLFAEDALFTAFGTLCSVAARRPAAAAGGMILSLGALFAGGVSALLFFPDERAAIPLAGPFAWAVEASSGQIPVGPLLAGLSVAACLLFIAIRLLEDERCR